MANTNLLPSSGDLNLSLTNPRVTTQVAGLGLSGLVPTLVINLGDQVRLTPGLGAIVTTGQTPTDISAALVTPTVGTLTLVGNTSGGPLVPTTPPTGSLTVTGITGVRGQGIVPKRGALTLTLGVSEEPDTGFLSLAGAAPTVQSGVTIPVLTPTRGTLVLAGITPVVSSGAGSVVRTPNVGGLFFGEGTVLTPAAGTMTIATAAASLRLNTIEIATTGTLPLTGSSLTTRINVIKNTPAGTLILTGVVPNTPNPPITPGTALLLFLNGFTPTLVRTLTPGTATLTLTGQPGAIPGNPQPVPSTGALVLTGLQGTLQSTGHVIAQPSTGTLTMGSTAPGIRVDVRTVLPTGDLAVQGAPPKLSGLQITPATATLILEVLEGAAPPIIIGGPTVENPMVGRLSLSGQAPVVLTFRLTRGYRFTIRPRRGAIVVPERTE
jgi:hypothetical protein